MSYYKLEDRCVFVDAFLEDGNHRPPHPQHPEVPIVPQIIDKRPLGQPQNYKFYVLSETAAYILRYLLLKVDQATISQMMVAEFHHGAPGQPITQAEAATEINRLITNLTGLNLLKVVNQPLPRNKFLEQAQSVGSNPFTQGLPVDFSVGTNQIGWIVFKGPFT